jgi:hypothetical protein
MTSAASPETLRAWTTFAFRTLTGVDGPVPDVPADHQALRRLCIAPLVYHAYRLIGTPGADFAAAAAEYRHAATANLIRLAHGALVRDALEARGIPVVLLKGGAFLLRYCDEAMGVRPMADLDLLVSPDMRQGAEQTLRACGFDALYQARRSDRVAHARSFVSTRAPMDIDLDLHLGVARWPIATELSSRILQRHDRISGWRVARLPEAFCLSVLHRARHGFAWSAFDLFELKMMAQQLDASGWNDVLECASANGLRGAAWASYRQAVWWLGCDDGDDERVASLARGVGVIRRRLLARMAGPQHVFVPDWRWQRPLARNFLVLPCATTLPRALTAAAGFLPARVADEWTAAKASGVGSTGRMRWLLKYVWRGREIASDRSHPQHPSKEVA